MKHFLANEWDRAHALKRGGGQVPVSIDLVEAERWYVPSVVEEATPESCLNAAGLYPFLNKSWPGCVRNSPLREMPISLKVCQCF